MLVGVVGKSGAGKSSFVEKLKKIDNNIVHIDIDKIGQDILKDQNIISHIVSIVGDSSVLENGILNRKKVGNIIFNDVKKYEEYYRYTEDIEYAVIDKMIEDNIEKIIVLDWILLDKTKYWSVVDYKILIDTNYEIRKNRVVKRDNISEEYFDLREVMKDSYNINEMDLVLDGDNISEEKIIEILGELR